MLFIARATGTTVAAAPRYRSMENMRRTAARPVAPPLPRFRRARPTPWTIPVRTNRCRSAVPQRTASITNRGNVTRMPFVWVARKHVASRRRNVPPSVASNRKSRGNHSPTAFFCILNPGGCQTATATAAAAQAR